MRICGGLLLPLLPCNLVPAPSSLTFEYFARWGQFSFRSRVSTGRKNLPVVDSVESRTHSGCLSRGRRFGDPQSEAATEDNRPSLRTSQGSVFVVVLEEKCQTLRRDNEIGLNTKCMH
jgi:hypothetical protein